MNTSLQLLLLFFFLCGVQCERKSTFVDFNFDKIFANSVLPANAGKLETQIINYESQGTPLGGFLAQTSNGSLAARPGLLLLHDSAGVDEFIRTTAQGIAKLGYVVFAADLFGVGIRPDTPATRSGNSTLLKSNRDVLRARVASALTVLRNQPATDISRLGALGFGLGGTAALEAARAGHPLVAVASVYGDLVATTKSAIGDIKGSLLIMNAAADQTVSLDSINALQQELTTLGVDWQLINYGGVRSGFNQPSATDLSGSSAYNAGVTAKADRELRSFFQERFSA